MKTRFVRTDVAILAVFVMAFSSAANAFSAGVNGGGFLDIFGGALSDTYTITGSGDATATTLDFSWSLTNEGFGNIGAPGSVFLTGFDSLDFSGTPSGTRTFTSCSDTSGSGVCFSIPILTPVMYDFIGVDDPLLFAGDTGLYLAEVANVGIDLLTYSESNFVTSTIPVPAAVWLFGSALGLLGWMRRKAT